MLDCKGDRGIRQVGDYADAIHVELSDQHADGRVRVALDRLDGVREVSLDGRSLRARADIGATAVPAVVTALEAQGVRVASVMVARPSLDDVYLRHTGRAFGRTEDHMEVSR